MIFTNSAFYYGLEINDANKILCFDDGAGELIATLRIGKYTLTSLAGEVARAMNEVATQEYGVTIDRSSRIFTIAISSGSPTDFSLLVSTGSTASSVFSTIGFSGSDRTGATSFQGSLAVGSSYRPQFRLQDFVDFNDNQKAQESNVLQSASGQVEVVKFGNIKLMECVIAFITNRDQGHEGYIRTDLNGVTNARNFLLYATTKGPIEFVPNIATPNTFTKCILETTSESQNGTSFRLKEEYSRGLVGYFSTGKLSFREIT